MRYSKVAKQCIQVFVLTLAIMISYISFIGGYSALLILEDEDNIDFNASFSGDIMTNPSLFEMQVEFTINNVGYTDLEDLKIELELLMIYYADYNNDGISEAVELIIFDDDKSFDTIKAGDEKKNKVTVEYKDITNVNWIDLQLNADPRLEIHFIAETLVISAKYPYGLMTFIVEFEDLNLGIYYF